MNDMTIGGFGAVGQTQTMSTLEIAELTGKRHHNVMADARKMLIELHGEGGLLKFQDTHRNEQNGQDYPILRLPKRETLILVSGYNLKMRASIIDRWQELEAQEVTFAIPQSYSEALRLAADNADRADRAEARIALDAPKVAFAEQVEAAPDAIGLGQAAKVFGTGRNRFCSKLREIGWLTRTNEPYQDKINAGLLDVKLGSWDHPEKGLQRSVTALVTGKGMTKLHNIIGTTH